MPDARTEVLTRIRMRLAQAGGDATRASDYAAIPRRYRTAGSLGPAARTALLLERLADYDAELLDVEELDVASAIADVLARHRERVLVVPAALPEAWLPEGVEILRDGGSSLPLKTLTSAQAVLTPCAVAIAETGTLVLQHGCKQGRRAISLLPDHHLCVLRKDQIVETVSEGWARIQSLKGDSLTTVSGPSATADIEMTRIRGVHGPRRLTVLLLR